MRGLVRVVCVCVAAVAAGCSSDESSSASTLAACPSTAVTTTGTADCSGTTVDLGTSTTQAPATTTTTIADPTATAISDCVAYIPIGAFTGSPDATTLWTFVSQDPSRLQELCTQLQIDNPALLAGFSTEYAAVLAAAPPVGGLSATDAPAIASSTSSP